METAEIIQTVRGLVTEYHRLIVRRRQPKQTIFSIINRIINLMELLIPQMRIKAAPPELLADQ